MKFSWSKLAAQMDMKSCLGFNQITNIVGYGKKEAVILSPHHFIVIWLRLFVRFFWLFLGFVFSIFEYFISLGFVHFQFCSVQVFLFPIRFKCAEKMFNTRCRLFSLILPFILCRLLAIFSFCCVLYSHCLLG